MMNPFGNQSIKLPIWVMFIVVLTGIAVIVAYFFYGASNSKLSSVLGGVLGGLIVYILTFASGIFFWEALEKYRKTGIVDVVRNRHDKEYYRPILKEASLSISVMGTSCSRFFGDFLDLNADDKILVDSLHSNQALLIRILIPSDNYMAEESLRRWKSELNKVRAICDKFSERVVVRRMDHEARHSFVLTDAELVAGPIFEGVESKHSPAVRIRSTTPYAKKYEQYFDAQWSKAEPADLK